MSDPNPYEPPQTLGRLAHESAVRRGFSVTAILLLSPFAALVAGCAGFWLAMMTLLSIDLAPGHYDAFIMLVALTTFVATLAGMLRWAWCTHQREQQLRQSDG